MIKDIYETIKEYDTIIIHRHLKPDGDAMGAQIGLKQAILDNFSNKRVYVVGDVTPRYEFIGKMDEIDDEVYNDSLVIVVDTGAKHLISDERFEKGKYLIKIDHHIPQGEYGDLAFVDTSFESASGIIAYFVKENNMKMTSEAAIPIYTGMISDSARFRFGINPRTFELAGFLLEAGIDLGHIYNHLYLDDLDSIRLRASLTLKFKVLDCGLAYLKNTYQDVLKYGKSPFSISRGMVNVMSGIKGIYIWVNFTETEEGKILVEFRSTGPNVNEIATKYGGGGHLLASGATVDSFDVVENIIEDLKDLLERNGQ